MQVNIIIGVSGGIGKAIALELLSNNVEQHLILTARKKNKLPNTLTAKSFSNNKISFYILDVCSEKSVQSFFKNLKTKIKKIDNLFYCVGKAKVCPTNKMSLNDWHKIINTNLSGAFLVYKYSYNFLKENSNLIFISSIGAKEIFANWTAYCVSKIALNKFCDCIREELRTKKVKVSCVMPAATNTNLWDKIKGEWQRKNMLSASAVAKIILNNIHQDNAVAEEIIIRSRCGNL